MPNPWPHGRRRPASAKAALAVLAAAVLLVAGLAGAQEIRFFRIGTGAVDSTFFPIGGVIASAISNPPGSRPCDKGGSCGVKGLIAVAQTTHGSMDNIAKIAAGEIEAALSLANLAYWAYHGTGIFAGRGAVQNLRAVANLYSGLVHTVVRADSDIFSLADLRQRRVSLGAEKSGTVVEAAIILEAYGVGIDEIEALYHKPGPSMDLLREGKIDALFLVGGAPTAGLVELARTLPIRILPIGEPQASRIREAYPFFAPARLQAGTYHNVPAIPTLSVGAQLVVAAEVDDELIYGITRALWHEANRPLFAASHPLGRTMRLENALRGLGIPLHPGAALYYFDRGIVAGGPI